MGMGTALTFWEFGGVGVDEQPLRKRDAPTTPRWPVRVQSKGLGGSELL